MVFHDPRNRRHDLRAPRLPALHPRPAIERSLEAQAAGLRTARAQDLHVALCPHFCAAHPQRRADSGSARHCRRLLRQSCGRREHQRRQRRCGERRQPFRRAFQEEDFSADDAADGRGRRIDGPHRHDAGEDGRLLGSKKSRPCSASGSFPDVCRRPSPARSSPCAGTDRTSSPAPSPPAPRTGSGRCGRSPRRRTAA